MNFTATSEFLQNFETSKIVAYLQTLNLQELIHNPYFLGCMAMLSVTCLLMRWRVLLVTILTVSGFIWLLSYTLEQGTALQGGVGSETLMVFVGGGTVIVFLAIYFLFIRGE